MNKICLLFLILNISCQNEEELPKAKFWKFAGGAHFGDIIKFDESFVLRNDTVFRANQPIFILKEFNNQWYLGRNQIVLQDLQTQEIGYYIGK